MSKDCKIPGEMWIATDWRVGTCVWLIEESTYKAGAIKLWHPLQSDFG
jgi:hypothetical protein